MSTRGTCFKSSAMQTELVATVQWNGQTISDISGLHAAFGTGAYLQWSWCRSSDPDLDGKPVYSIIAATNSHISQNGFVFTVTPADVDRSITFRCSLMLPE